MEKDFQAVQLKVVLEDSNPPIWRRIVVRDDMTFYELHWAIQVAMAWSNSYLYEFTAEEYRIGEIIEELEGTGYGKHEILQADSVTLQEILSVGVKRFIYVYDFEDYWVHEVLVEKIESVEEGSYYPYCLDARFNAPPEGCGGVSRYHHLLEVMKDENHPEHHEIKEWLADFDLEDETNLEDINEDLRHLQDYIDDFENGENF